MKLEKGTPKGAVLRWGGKEATPLVAPPWEMNMQLPPRQGFVCHLLLNKLKGPILFLFAVKLMQKAGKEI